MKRAIPQVYKAEEWESNGYWHVNDTSDLCGIAGHWWVPARILGKSPAEFIEWLIETYQPDRLHYDGKNFFYSWSNYGKAHSYLLYINKVARQKKFLV